MEPITTAFILKIMTDTLCVLAGSLIGIALAEKCIDYVLPERNKPKKLCYKNRLHLEGFSMPLRGSENPRSSIDVVRADDRRSVDVSIRCEAASRNIDPFLESATIVADSERMKSTEDE
jgi:hypothetical protein